MKDSPNISVSDMRSKCHYDILGAPNRLWEDVAGELWDNGNENKGELERGRVSVLKHSHILSELTTKGSMLGE